MMEKIAFRLEKQDYEAVKEKRLPYESTHQAARRLLLELIRVPETWIDALNAQLTKLGVIDSPVPISLSGREHSFVIQEFVLLFDKAYEVTFQEETLLWIERDNHAVSLKAECPVRGTASFSLKGIKAATVKRWDSLQRLSLSEVDEILQKHLSQINDAEGNINKNLED